MRPPAARLGKYIRAAISFPGAFLLLTFCWPTSAVAGRPPAQSQTSDQNAGHNGSENEFFAVEQLRQGRTANNETRTQLQNPDLKPDQRQALETKLREQTKKDDTVVDQFPQSPVVQLEGARNAKDDQDTAKVLARASAAETLAQKSDPRIAYDAAMMQVDAYRVQGDRDGMIAAYKRARDYDPSKKDEIDQALVLIEGHSIGARGIKVAKDPFAAQANGENQQLVGATKAPVAPSAAGAAAAGMSPELARLFKDAEAKLELDPKATEDLAGRILGVDAANANAYFLRGLARKQQREFARAIEDFTKAITLGLRNALVYAARAAAYEATRDLAKAEADALRAARLEPKNGRRFLQLGQIQAELGKTAEAQTSLDQAQAIDPSLADAARALERQISVPAAVAGRSKSQGWLLLSCAAALFFVAGAIAWWKSQGDAAALSKGNSSSDGRPSTVDDTPTLERAPQGGDRIGQFELRRRAGHGGMGEVWEAWDHSLSRRVALKRIIMDRSLDEHARELFIAEARTAASLTHPNKPEIYGLYEGVPSHALWLAQEYVAGGTVADALTDGPLDARLCVSIAKGVASLLDCFHANKIIHRDLKPSNILLDGTVAKVADFGIARATSRVDGTMTMQPAGTPAFMAPEQYDGVVSPQTDLFALGVTLFQCVTGSLPFAPHDIEAKRAGRFARATARCPALPSEIDAFFERALNASSARRFENGAALAAAFEKALGNGQAKAKDGSHERPTTPA